MSTTGRFDEGTNNVSVSSFREGLLFGFSRLCSNKSRG